MAWSVFQRLRRHSRGVSLQSRLTWIIAGVCLGTLLVINLAWLPSSIGDLQRQQRELRELAARSVRDRIRLFLDDNAEVLRTQALQSRLPFFGGDSAELRVLGNRFLHQHPVFEELAILDAHGHERFRLAQTQAFSAADLRDRSEDPLFATARTGPAWGRVIPTATALPTVSVGVPLPPLDAGAPPAVLIGILTLRPLWELTSATLLAYGGRTYVVDEEGRLIAADDSTLVLQRLSFADRPPVRQAAQAGGTDETTFLHGRYVNERGMEVLAIGMLVKGPRWTVVVEQAKPLLYAPVRRKIGYALALSVIGVAASVALGRLVSRRLTGPLTRLQEGVQRFGAGDLDHRVDVEAPAEIRQLATQFNDMAVALDASRQALEEKVAARTRELQGLLNAAKSLMSGLDLKAILDQLVAEAVRISRAPHVKVLLVDREAGALRVGAVRGSAHVAGDLLPLDRGASGRVATSGEPYFNLHHNDDPRNLYAKEDRAVGIVTYLGLPIKRGGEVLGVLTFNTEAPKEYSPDELAYLNAFADQAAIALENARLYGDVQRELRQRQAAEESLRKIARVVEQSPNIVVITDAAGAIEYVNPKFTEVTGYSAEEAIGQNPRILKSGGTSPEEYAALWKTIRSGQEWRGEFRNRKKNGEYFWEAASISPIRGADGRITHFVAVKEDITQRKTTEAALRDAHELTEQVVRSAQEGIFVLDRELRYQAWNPYMEQLTGVPAPSLLGRPALDAFEFLREAGVDIALRQALNGQAVAVPAFPFRVPETGRSGWSATTLGPLHDAQGAIVGVIGTVRDVTAQKQAEAVLRQSEERARRLAEENAAMAEIGRTISSTLQIDDIYEEFSAEVKKVLPADRIVISVIDVATNTFKHVHMSKEPLEDRSVGVPLPLAGSGIAEMVRTRSSFLLQTDDFAPYRDRFPMLESTFQAGFRSMLHVPLFVKGEMIGALLLRSRTRSAYADHEVRLAERIGAQIAGTIANAQLYAERVAAEEQRAALEEQLRQSQKMEAIGQLAGGVAHDFNNLLTVITGYSQMLLARVADKRTHGNVAEILKAGERASALTQQLLAFSRKQVVQPRVLDVNAHVENLQKMLRRLIGEDVTLEARLGQPAGRVLADSGQLEQVIINLAVNARDAMPQGGRLLIETATVVLEEPFARGHDLVAGNYVALTVSDTGCGMSSQVRERIFEPFFTTKGEGKGTGLGLSTVYGIVRQSGGAIAVRSEAGRGSSFTIYLPRVEDPVEPADDLASLEPARGRGETVLVVEDAGPVRCLAAEVLDTHGYRVREADSAERALEILAAGQADVPDLLLTDVILPGMNGVELSRRVAADYSTVKVILMSGYTHHFVLRDGALDPDEPFLQKPFSPMGLLQRVAAVLGDHRSTPSAAVVQEAGQRVESAGN